MAAVMQLGRWQRLAWIELPLASVTIMAGIKTAAVLTVGTATLAAFIGGGGYGTLIVTGLALNDVRMILAGAIPAALMALAIHVAFGALDRPRGPRPLLGTPAPHCRRPPCGPGTAPPAPTGARRYPTP